MSTQENGIAGQIPFALRVGRQRRVFSLLSQRFLTSINLFLGRPPQVHTEVDGPQRLLDMLRTDSLKAHRRNSKAEGGRKDLMERRDTDDFDIDGFLGCQSQPLSPFEVAFCRHYVRASLASGESSEELFQVVRRCAIDHHGSVLVAVNLKITRFAAGFLESGNSLDQSLLVVYRPRSGTRCPAV